MEKINLKFWGLTLILILFARMMTMAQEDPYGWSKPVYVQSNDVFLLWNENVTGTYKSYQKVYRYKIDSTFLSADSMISKTPRQEDGRTSSTSSLYCDAASGRFNKDPFDDVVSVWYGQAGIEIMIPKFDTTDALWTTTIQDNINTNENEDRIYVRTGDFDSDSLDEFVVGYLDPTDSVHLNVYDLDSTLTPTLTTSFSDQKLVSAYGYQFVRYFIESGDFNGDGKDEIVLFSVEVPPPSSAVRVKVQIYDLENKTLVPKGQTNIDVPRLTTLEDFAMSAAAGQYKNDDKEELSFITIRSSEGVHYSYDYILEVSSDLQTITIGPRLRVTPSGNNNFFDLSTSSGDLNNDGRDEIVYTSDTEFYILAADDNLNLTLKYTGNVASGGTNDYKQSYDYLKVKDVNQDHREDIIIAKNFVQNQFADGFFVAMITVNDALNQTALLGRLFGDEAQLDAYQPFAIAVGNFDGSDFTIGQPFHYTQNDVVQTLVKLNAPPLHFDVLGGQTYDVNHCYNGNDCNFYTEYIKNTISSVEVSTKVNRDWEVSAGVHVSGDVTVAPFGVGATVAYNAYFLHKWGRHFSNDTTSIQTVSVSYEILSSDDDQIYATVSDYDLWEYPLYYGNEEFPRQTIMTLVPNNVRGHWFPSKSYNAISYLPDHEVGNILSYYPYDTLSNNPNVEQTIKADYVSDSFTLSTNPNQNWYLSFDDFKSEEADTVKENTNSWGFSFVVEATGNFGNTTYTTHKTSVNNQLQIHTKFGALNMNIGDVKYKVTPYSYWDKNGGLVIDYSVKPELAPPGFPHTWWQDMYGNKSDPTFVLPWRLDPEKGFALSEEAKRYQTNDIIFSPADPSPNDTVTITARMRNYSLIPTPSSVSVSFYIGDPDSNGIPIVGLNGSNTVSTLGPILAQGRSDVQFKFIMPNGLSSYPRIYAVLDQENTINEIHENNNKGFNVLGRQTITTEVTNEENFTPSDYLLYQSYPNPFNSTTTIKYSIPKQSKVVIKVFGILGNEVATLKNEEEPGGTYQVSWNAVNVSSGVYFYQLKADNFIETKKMILLK